MKRYFVISHQSNNNGHINTQNLLPASCKLITGIAANATVKQAGQLGEVVENLVFPQALITKLLQGEAITGLFYSYLRTRPDGAESRAFFESSMLPAISNVLSNNITYTCLGAEQQQELKGNIQHLYNQQFADYIYKEAGLFEEGQEMGTIEFADYIAWQTLFFAYTNKASLFKHKIQAYNQPAPYDCGNISLLVNGNSFLLRDYILTANRKLRSMGKEVIPFHEPLEVNSNINTVFKSNKNNGSGTLTIRIYIQYEHQ